MPKISVIIPCYYNEANIPVTSRQLLDNEKDFPTDVSFEYIMVDDGSRDNTFNELVKFHASHPEKVKVLKLAGNVGSYNAILAGMAHVSGDCCVVLCADLQDPPELIVKMYDYWTRGIKLVMANRADREESWGQRTFSAIYHNLIRKLAISNIPKGGFDFVFFDRKLNDEVVKMNEKNTNTLYLLPWLGYDYVSIPYTRRKRQIGKSRWTMKKKIKLFVDSFVSFSFFPIRVISVTGLLLGICAILYALFIVIAHLTGYIALEGWTTMMVVFLLISSFQMIAIGILGEYVWRSLDASRNRPIYVIDQMLGQEAPKERTLS